jgi:hypothetical protein
MNTFEGLEHALLAGVVLGTLKRAGIDASVILNAAEDTTPYFKLSIDGIDAVIVVLPTD